MWGSTCVCVCVLLQHLGVFLWVSLAHTYTNPRNDNSLKQPEQSSRWQIHTHNTEEPNPRFRVLAWPTTLYCLLHMMIFKFIAHNSNNNNNFFFLNVLCGPMKRNLNIVSRKSSTLDAKVSFFLTKDQNLVHHNFCFVVGYTYLLSSPLPRTNKTKQDKGCVTLSGLCHLHYKVSLKAKEDLLWKLKIFHHAKIHLIFKTIL